MKCKIYSLNDGYFAKEIYRKKQFIQKYIPNIHTLPPTDEQNSVQCSKAKGSQNKCQNAHLNS